MHPSQPNFSSGKSVKNAINKGHLDRHSLDPDSSDSVMESGLESVLESVLDGVKSGASGADPIEMLETQLDVALDQLNGARQNLMKARQRVGDLQEVVARLEEFLQIAGSHTSRGGTSAGESERLERHSA